MGSDSADSRDRLRRNDLARLVHGIRGRSALDVGTRDGAFAKHLAAAFDTVVALDLYEPTWRHPGVRCVKGDVTHLKFDHESFDLVVCTEVLEHVPSPKLAAASLELERVTRGHLLVGVPFMQDLRVGRTTCDQCGATNPPWGHVNAFDAQRLLALFGPRLVVEQVSYVGRGKESTNSLSAWLMDRGRNPYGTYEQSERCIACGKSFGPPAQRSLVEKAFGKAGFWARRATEPFGSAHPLWIHCLFRKGAHAPEDGATRVLR